MSVDYEWRLRVLMAERGMFKASDLALRLAEHGVRLSDSQVWRLVTGRPERMNLRVLVVLCEILGCEAGELLRRGDVAAPAAKEPASGRSIAARDRARRRTAAPSRSRCRSQAAAGSSTSQAPAPRRWRRGRSALASRSARSALLRRSSPASREAADPAAAAALAPYLAGLAGAPNPDSRLRWLQSPALSLLEALLAGTVELSHAGLDQAQGAAFPARAVAFLRAGLVDQGALEARDEHSARFAHWQQRATEQIAPGPTARTCAPTRPGRSLTSSPAPSSASDRPRQRRSTRAGASAKQSSSSCGFTTSNSSWQTCARTSSTAGSPTGRAAADG